jgi:hypothetical protein
LLILKNPMNLHWRNQVEKWREKKKMKVVMKNGFAKISLFEVRIKKLQFLFRFWSLDIFGPFTNFFVFFDLVNSSNVVLAASLNQCHVTIYFADRSNEELKSMNLNFTRWNKKNFFTRPKLKFGSIVSWFSGDWCWTW